MSDCGALVPTVSKENSSSEDPSSLPSNENTPYTRLIPETSQTIEIKQDERTELSPLLTEQESHPSIGQENSQTEPSARLEAEKLPSLTNDEFQDFSLYKPTASSREWNSSISDIFQDVGCGDGLANVESDDELGPCTPPAVLWSKGIRFLLEDEIGHSVFRNYMEREMGSAHMLFFWYACKGLRLGEYEGDIKDSIEVIWKHFIKNKSVEISAIAYALIEDQIKHKNFTPGIFDQAQIEIEDIMRETVYRSFLESEDYFRCLGPLKRDDLGPIPPYQNFLPTLHEGFELAAGQAQYPKLTQGNLIASAPYRVTADRVKPEANAGDNRSFMSLSQHGPSTKREQRRHNQKIRDFAQLNKETPDSTALSQIYIMPRTMLPGHHQNKRIMASENPREFERVVSEKLQDFQKDQDRKFRLKQSLFKVTQGEDVAEEARKEHAVNALPPDILKDRLIEEKIQLEELDPSQSILDDHVARIWDSPVWSPGSPKDAVAEVPFAPPPPNRPLKSAGTRTLPHPSYQNPPLQLTKCSLRSLRHQTTPNQVSFHLAQSVSESRVSRGFPGVPPFGPPLHNSMVHQGYSTSRNYHHGRRRDRDVNSTFSSDSGNVPDSPDVQDRLRGCVQPLGLGSWRPMRGEEHPLPKSKSMPEHMESHLVGVLNEVGLGGPQCHMGMPGVPGNSRRGGRKPHPDFTDSGVSVVSDSGRSAALSTTSDRVESWLFQSSPYGEGGSFSVYPGDLGRGSLRMENTQKPKNLVRSTHTMAGSTSPGMQRKGTGSSGRRSQCSSSTSATTCINTRPEMSSGATTVVTSRQSEMSPRDSPLGQAQPSVTCDRRKARGSVSSISGKSSGMQIQPPSDFGSDTNGVANCKQMTQSGKQGFGVDSSSGWRPAPNSAPATPSADVTVVVYTFQDDNVPFIIKVPARPISLKRFKAHLHKKGSFRYFFKKFCEEMATAVFEEITEDSEILPLFEGKVFVQIHKEE